MLTSNTKLLIQIALNEDIGSGDVTTEPLVPVLGEGKFAFIAGENFMLAGVELVKAVYKEIDPELEVQFKYEDGDFVQKGMAFGMVSGSVASILKGERVALNFLQRVSGVASHAFKISKILLGTGIKLTDTRKTTAGWRSLEKYAVRVGGGVNHRFGLYDSVVIKENHIDAAGGIEAAVSLVRQKAPISCKIEIEVRDIREVKEALQAKADIIMLKDDMDIQVLVEACNLIKGKAKIEIAGDVNERTLERYKKLNVDYVSMGTLINSARSVIISLKVLK